MSLRRFLLFCSAKLCRARGSISSSSSLRFRFLILWAASRANASFNAEGEVNENERVVEGADLEMVNDEKGVGLELLGLIGGGADIVGV